MRSVEATTLASHEPAQVARPLESFPTPPLTLAPPVVVQRAPESVQRVEREETTEHYTPSVPGAQAEETEKAKSTVNLDQVARQILPVIKRMLAVELERRFSR